MMGLEREIIIYLYAMITGISMKCMYDILYLFRKMVRHAGWVIGLEDVLYWIVAAVFLFVGMFQTTYGSVRWFSVLGVVCGVLLEWTVKKQLKKVLDKIKKTI